jgi:hypothetical protein
VITSCISGTKKMAQQKVKQVGMFGWISSVILFLLYLIWATIPDEILSLVFGFNMFPDKYCLLAFPAWLIVTFFYIGIMYVCLNLMATPHLDSFEIITYDQNIKTSEVLSSSPSSLSSFGKINDNESSSSHSHDKKGSDITSPQRTVPDFLDLDIRLVNRHLYGNC